ncbi:MAG: type I restriction enzyme HsdR N-terminal domain-containing protein [Rhodothermales bacterium]|nr:type I restriction enzyme HsdR N-terminal domain-containing protein [Rhodothermales bacterium]
MKRRESVSEEADRLESLDVPEVSLDVVVRDGKRFVRDPVRRKLVRLTPEEWVRQYLLQYLIGILRVPPGLIAVEKAFDFNGMTRRADVVVYDRGARPVVLVECKAPDVAIDQSVFDQVGRYNTAVGALFVIVSNGIAHYCYRMDASAKILTFVSGLPEYEELILERAKDS